MLITNSYAVSIIDFMHFFTFACNILTNTYMVFIWQLDLPSQNLLKNAIQHYLC